MAFLGIGKTRAQKALRRVLDGAEPPSFPALTLQILEKLRDPEVEFEELSEVIRWDPALTLKLLATVNSSAFAPKRRIEDVRHAISYLGRGQLENMVLAVAVRGTLPTGVKRGFDAGRFWRTAAQRAALARALSSKLHPAREGEAFTGALLLDMAIPVLVDSLGDPYCDVLEEWHASPDARLHELEDRAWKRTHADIGGLLADSWELPAGLASTIALHHDESKTDRDLLPAIRLVAVMREVDSEAALEKLVETAKDEYGLESSWTLGAIEASRGEAEELGRVLAEG